MAELKTMTDELFQSTFPLQGTTRTDGLYRVAAEISIHVPIAGNDYVRQGTQGTYRNFNPRSHCRERPETSKQEAGILDKFQSTFPLQGTTHRYGAQTGTGGISIHVPIAGNDSKLIQFLIYNCKIFVLYYSYL